MIVAMVKASAISKQFDLSSLQHLVVGALPITEKILMDFKELIPQCKIVRVYGLTETAVVLTFGHPDDLMAGSVGFLLPGHEARLATLDGEEVTTYDTPGQLLIRSKTVMLGYLDNKEATDETIGSDGWLRTGDLAEFRQSKKGNDHLFIVDRVKEMIKVRVRITHLLLHRGIELTHTRVSKSHQRSWRRTSSATNSSQMSPSCPSPMIQPANFLWHSLSSRSKPRR